MTFEFVPRGVCARKMVITVEDGIVTEAQILGGCHGNSQGVAALVKGMPAKDVIQRLSGIRCGYKATSCPDQLAAALKKHLSHDGE